MILSIFFIKSTDAIRSMLYTIKLIKKKKHFFQNVFSILFVEKILKKENIDNI